MSKDVCCCRWKECSSWMNKLKEIHPKLGCMYEFRFNRLIKNPTDKMKKSSDQKQRQSIQTIVKNKEGFLNCIIKHIKPQNYVKGNNLYIARHHFPHQYFSTNNFTRYPIANASLTKDEAIKFNIGVFPDEVNLIPDSTKEKRYFLAPVVTHKYMSDFMASVEKPQHVRSTRSERYAKRSHRAISLMKTKEVIESSSEDEYDKDKESGETGAINTTSDQNNSVTIINSVDDYLPKESFFLEKMENLISDLVRKSSVKSREKSFSKSLNESLAKNIHFHNIASLLTQYRDFSMPRKPIEICRTEARLFLYHCCSGIDTSHHDQKKKCLKFYVSSYMLERGNFLCSECEDLKKQHQIRNVRAEKNKQNNYDPTSPSSRVNITKLSGDLRKTRLRRRRNESIVLKQKLSKTLTSGPSIHLDSENNGVERQILNCMKMAGSVDKRTQNCFKESIVQCIVGDIGSTDKSKLQEATEFAEETTNHIMNFRKKIEGNIHGVRYTAREIRMAMILYSMSPSGYREIRNSDIQILPSVNLLKKYKKEIKVKEGCDPLSYGTLRDRLNVKPGEIVSATLMFDEMKLKNDIYTNIVTGEIVGFASNDMTLESCRDDICSMMKEIEKEQDNGDYEFSVDEFDLEANVQATYVNQFRVRQIIGNKSTNVEFFFNDGSLSGNEIMFQLFHVLSMLNNVNIAVLFVNIDAGGSNSRLFSLLRHEAQLGNDGWLNDSMVTFKDPTATHTLIERLIAYAHCSTHVQKALRNALLNSSIDSKSPRYFQSLDNIFFTWQCIVNCFERDRMRSQKVTSLGIASVYPNSWSKMRVGYSLCPFSEKTLVEQLTYLGEKFKCVKDMYFDGDFKESKDVSQMYLNRLGILKSAIDKIQKDKSMAIDPEDLSAFAGLEYCVYVAIIFNLRFMDKNSRITRENISDWEDDMKKATEYFSTWRSASLSRKVPKNTDWEKSFIPKQTFNNLRIQISGFIAFAKIAFAFDKNIKYIPALLSNQSSLESSFSEKRARNDDSPQKYVNSTATESHVKASKALSSNKNRMYEGTVDVNENQVASVHFDKKLMSCIRNRHEKVEAWMSSAKADTPTTIKLPLMDSNAYDQYSSRFTSTKSIKKERDFDNSALMAYMKEKYIESNFLYTLVTETKIVDSAKASVGANSETELWFKSLLTMKDENDIKSFDCVCQRVVSLVLSFLKRTCSASKGTRFSSLWYNIYYSIQEGEMFRSNGPFSCLPSTLSANQTGKYILLENIVHYIENLMTERKKSILLNSPKMSQSNPVTDDERNHSVNGFVGFALSEVIRKYEQKRYRASIDADDSSTQLSYSDYENILIFVKNMRILHHDALLDDEYSSLYYSSTDKMLNHGGLTLISKQYMTFAIYLMKLCDEHINEKMIYLNRNKSFKISKKNILEDKHLREVFNLSHKDKELCNKVKDHLDAIYIELVSKTIHSKFSAEIKKVREKHFSHFAKSSSKETHRDDLRHDNKRKMKNLGEKVQQEMKKAKTTEGNKD